jgi:DNA-binding transcriptional regulator YiaG
MREEKILEYLDTKFQELNEKITKSNEEKNNQKEWLTSGQVAKMLHVSMRTIYNWNSCGKLQPNNEFGKLLYRREDIENLLNKN